MTREQSAPFGAGVMIASTTLALIVWAGTPLIVAYFLTWIAGFAFSQLRRTTP